MAETDSFKKPWFGLGARDVQLTRWVVLRAQGFVFSIAFLVLVRQAVPLFGTRGLLPIDAFLPRVRAYFDSGWLAFWEAPSLFWVSPTDVAIRALSWCGLLLSLAVMCGFANSLVMALVWVLYGSFVHTGQIFYGYGWDILLLEMGFLGIFLAPPWRFRDPDVPALPVVWLYRWLLFRLMFGAGMIKLRGDDCWRDLTCLAYHYETQPNPHPLSWLLHQAPLWFHRVGTLFNHFAELVVPWGVFGPRRLRHFAGGVTILFQVILILSGNLSFLNWATIVIALACFDDTLLGRLLPARLVSRVRAPEPAPLGRTRRYVLVALSVVVLGLSLNPIANLFDARQRMNASFEPLHLVNTYGAFGSVGRERTEVVIEGTDATSPGEGASWREYPFPCKPGDVLRAPCLVTPYHYRLDWQLWFAGLSNYRREPWIVHLVYQLLQGNPNAKSFLVEDPFPRDPPRYVRATLYRYRFTHFGEAGWWTREPLGPYLGITSLDDDSLLRFVRAHGWESPPAARTDRP